MYKALIVDDEPIARERVRRLLANEPDIEIAGECSDGEEAVERLAAADIDLLFLDVQMPRLDGIAVVEVIPRERMPVVIFITAYDDYAMRAFDAQAIDYLLKPYDRERFERALAKARRYLAATDRTEQGASISGLFGATTRYRQRVAVKVRGRTLIVKIESVDWIEAQGNYVRLHVGKDSFLIRESMRELAASLDPATFLRIHRSAIVNLDRIRELRANEHGDHRVVLADGTTIPLGRAYRNELEKLVGREF
jgi:two-component system LytT family response regulator